MKSVQEGMELRRADFNALVEQRQLCVESKGIPFAAQRRMLSLLAPMHRDSVNPHPQ